jgi:hypothetical protein
MLHNNFKWIRFFKGHVINNYFVYFSCVPNQPDELETVIDVEKISISMNR